jgi:NADPH2 dehydrogenase
MASETVLFKPLKIGNITISHRIAMAPLTRNRAEDDHLPGPLAKSYYSQRASVPGTILFTEGTQISPLAGGLGNAPGIWNEVQVAAWREIVAGVHAKGSFIYCQLFGAGRAAAKERLEIKGPSAIPINAEQETPSEYTEPEILELIEDFVFAARNAMRADFDGVEIHSGYGHLVDQFVQENSNQRTDAWGGSIEKRSRFAIEVVEAVAKEIGKEHVGIRFTPFGTYQSMRPKDPIAQFGYLIKELKKIGIGHLHLVEPRTDGIDDVSTSDSLEPLVDLWVPNAPGVLFLAGGFTLESAKETMDQKYSGKDIVIAFGRNFTSNPDLVYRMQKGIELTKYKRDVFYKAKSPDGYADWPFSAEYVTEYGSED